MTTWVRAVATAEMIAEKTNAWLCPRGCGEMIYTSLFRDDPPGVSYVVPVGSNESWRHDDGRCEHGRRKRMLSWLAPLGRDGEPTADEAVWDWRLRFRVSPGGYDEETFSGGLLTRRSVALGELGVHVRGGGLDVWRLLEDPSGTNGRFARPERPEMRFIAMQAWPVVDSERWMHREFPRLRVVDSDRGTVDEAPTAELETAGELGTTQTVVDSLPTDAPPWWRTSPPVESMTPSRRFYLSRSITARDPS